MDLPHLAEVVYKLVVPFVGCMDVVVEQPMDSMLGHHMLAADLFVAHNYLDTDDDVAVVDQPIDAIAIANSMSAFVQLDLVVAVFVLVLLAHPYVVHELDELSKIVVADFQPMFVAVAAISFQNKSEKNTRKKTYHINKLHIMAIETLFPIKGIEIYFDKHVKKA